MNFFLKTLCLYLVALIIGFLVWNPVLPILGVHNSWAVAHLPWSQSTFMMKVFMYYFYVRALIVLLAAALTALFAFFIHENRNLRWAVLSLPMWTPFLYAVFYIALIFH